MPSFIYIGKPHIHTTATLLDQQKHLHGALVQARRGNTPALSPDKIALMGSIQRELATRV